jgi:hypothetical protein
VTQVAIQSPEQPAAGITHASAPAVELLNLSKSIDDRVILRNLGLTIAGG